MTDESPVSIPQSSDERNGQVLVREIYKNGWLTIPTNEKKSRFNNKVANVNRKVWVAFCVHDDIEAFLEYYDGQSSVLAHKPLENWHLGSCLHVSPNIALQDEEYLFSVTLDSQTLTFSASTRDEMNEWIDIMRNRLIELGVLGPADNLYTKEPEQRPRLAPIRDPMSPLPPTPGLAAPPPGTIWPINYVNNNDNNNLDQATESPETPLPSTEATDVNPAVQLRQRTSTPTDRPQSARETITTIEFSDLSAESVPTPHCPLSAPPCGNGSVFDFTSLVLSADSEIYEPLYLSRSIEPESDANSRQQNDDDEATRNEQPVILSLKEKQVQQLQKEMTHEAGIRLRLRRKDCLNAIAFANYMDAAWVVGWKQKTHPLLYHSFHIGDKVLTIEGKIVKSSMDVNKIVRQCYTPYVEFIVARLPYGKAIAIKREFEGQDLGFLRDGNTAEILSVVNDGLAASHGLTARSPTPCGTSLCNWMLTEVNGRPLNLFFKGNEVQERLNAVGKDISILVQPADFVKILKKQLKSIRSYKDYIVQ